jgi:hypothetical protein
MFKSRMWSIGWNPPTPTKTTKKGANWAGLKSVPGRTPRLKAINLLQIAAEVEHALMVQYLYAAYSINEEFAQGRDDLISSTVSRWKRDICAVARQEMAHLITVQNLLMALGTDVCLDRENNFELHPDEYPFPVCFEPLSLKSLAKYVVTESPELSQISSRSERRSLKKASRLLRRDLRTRHPDFQEKINRVGVIYLTLYWLFLRSDDSNGPWDLPSFAAPCMEDAGLLGVHLEDSDFVSLSDFHNFEATPSEWHIYETEMKVSDTDPRAKALEAVHWIMEQGEGPAGMQHSKTPTTHVSHFQVFVGIFDDLQRNESQYRGAILDVPVNPFTADHRSPGAPSGTRNLITQPQAKLWAQLFNVRYQMLLVDILLALSMDRSQKKDLRQQLIDWAVKNEMQYLREIGQILPGLHRHPYPSARKSNPRGAKAGAPFVLKEVPLDTGKRWDLERVLIDGSEHLMKRLRKTADRGKQQDVLHAISAFDKARRTAVLDNIRVSMKKYSWKAGRVFRHEPRKGA